MTTIILCVHGLHSLQSKGRCGHSVKRGKIWKLMHNHAEHDWFSPSFLSCPPLQCIAPAIAKDCRTGLSGDILYSCMGPARPSQLFLRSTETTDKLCVSALHGVHLGSQTTCHLPHHTEEVMIAECRLLFGSVKFYLENGSASLWLLRSCQSISPAIQLPLRIFLPI